MGTRIQFQFLIRHELELDGLYLTLLVELSGVKPKMHGKGPVV